MSQTNSNYLNHDRSIRSWLLTVDHKRIGVMYLASVFVFFFLGGFFALLLRLDLWSNVPVLADFLNQFGYTLDNPNNTYNKLFTLHGVTMVFLFIVPSIPASLGNFVLPIMLGAKDVAFPRLNLASFYIYIFGAIFVLVAMIMGGVDTGWTFYTPYSIDATKTPVLLMGVGLFIVGFSSILTGLNFIVTIHELRAPGMHWFNMPLMIWALYATSIIQVLATPVIAVTLILLLIENLFGVGIFDPAYGGDPILFQHFFWFYSHPVVYVMILPAMGIMSELVTTFSKRNIFGYKAIAYSSIAIAVIAFLVWGHHMFVSGQSIYAASVFSFLTFLVAVPSGIKVFNWIATIYKGSIDWKAIPYLWAFSFFFLFAIGGFTGIFLGALSLDIHLHDTYFVVAHFHYVMMGGTVMAFIAGVHYWWPKMFGRMYSQFWAVITWFLVLVGFNFTFFPQFIMGANGMPRRYFYYDDQYVIFHRLSTIGTWVLGLGFFIMAIYLIYSLFFGKKTVDNPWDGRTLEWKTSSPPPHHNFIGNPTVKPNQTPYNYD